MPDKFGWDNNFGNNPAPKTPDTTKQMKATGEVLPCPFCGEHPEVERSGNGTGLMIHCIGKDCPNPSVSYYPPASARKVWNRRAAIAVNLPDHVDAAGTPGPRSHTRAALEGVRTVLADAIYLFDHPKQSEDEALCIRAMKAAGRTIDAALNPDGESR